MEATKCAINTTTHPALDAAIDLHGVASLVESDGGVARMCSPKNLGPTFIIICIFTPSDICGAPHADERIEYHTHDNRKLLKDKRQ